MWRKEEFFSALFFCLFFLTDGDQSISAVDVAALSEKKGWICMIESV